LDVLEIETIALKSGLTLEKVKELKDKQWFTHSQKLF
jgi:hypothetical protein